MVLSHEKEFDGLAIQQHLAEKQDGEEEQMRKKGVHEMTEGNYGRLS